MLGARARGKLCGRSFGRYFSLFSFVAEEKKRKRKILEWIFAGISLLESEVEVSADFHSGILALCGIILSLITIKKT